MTCSYVIETHAQEFQNWFAASHEAPDKPDTLLEIYTFEQGPGRDGPLTVTITCDGNNNLQLRGVKARIEATPTLWIEFQWRQIRDHSVFYDMGTWEFVGNPTGPDGTPVTGDVSIGPVGWHQYPQATGWVQLSTGRGGDVPLILDAIGRPLVR